MKQFKALKSPERKQNKIQAYVSLYNRKQNKKIAGLEDEIECNINQQKATRDNALQDLLM
jgi:hypothetical protein